MTLVPQIKPEALASDWLNRECFCITLDRDALTRSLDREAGDPRFCAKFIETRPHLFSNAPVFLPQAEIARMLRIVRAIEAATRLPAYREAALSWAPEIARRGRGPLGVFMGYDFHVADEGPRLIEVNTNAGGAFLNAWMARAHRACCALVEGAMREMGTDSFEQAVVEMFQHEWMLQRGSGTPRRVAIVDDEPSEQYLYPEFLIAQHLFRKHGLDCTITDARQLEYAHGRLLADGQPVDLVYNRVVDFSFDLPGHDALRAAYLDDAVVVTPNPHAHALFADKRNLTLLSDQTTLRSWGLPPALLAELEAVPRTLPVTAANADHLWTTRKKLFFKPAAGYGAKAVYRGNKLTRAVWAEILKDRYVAQDFAPPGERMVKIDGRLEARKADVRLYTYDGNILLTAARLYQGQTTNFRTPGGGFAPVFAI